ncbi:MAG TPA: hypothetical protein VLX61_05750 [Anaerolineales bacterium]|nr:hypothetical protein [Anaerolineales bacterium]
MTYREDFTLPAELWEQVQEQGLDILPELIRVIINTAMQSERAEHWNAELYQHNPERSGHVTIFLIFGWRGRPAARGRLHFYLELRYRAGL